MFAKWLGKLILTARPLILEQLEERIVLDAAVDGGAQDQQNEQQPGTDGGVDASAGTAQGEETASGTGSAETGDTTDILVAGSNGDIKVVLIKTTTTTVTWHSVL